MLGVVHEVDYRVVLGASDCKTKFDVLATLAIEFHVERDHTIALGERILRLVQMWCH
jgi:hypothetical protein